MDEETSQAPDVDQDQLTDEAPAPAEEADQASGQEESPEYFSDTFDPASLPEELRPAYQQMRADYTRKTQTVAEQKREQEHLIDLAMKIRDPEQQRHALKELGFSFEGEEENEDYEGDGEFEDGEDEYVTRAELQQFQQELALRERNAFLETEFDGLGRATGREFSRQQRVLIGNHAINVAAQTGKPLDVRGAYEDIVEAIASKQSRGSRKRQAAQAPSGVGGSKQVDLTKPQERIKAAAEAIEAAGDD
jgi:hypothetical protein